MTMKRRRNHLLGGEMNPSIERATHWHRPSYSSFRYRSFIFLTLILIGVSWVCLLLNVNQRRTTAIHDEAQLVKDETSYLRIQERPSQEQEDGSPVDQSVSTTLNQPTDKTNDSSSFHHHPQRWFWIGIVRDAHQVQASTWDVYQRLWFSSSVVLACKLLPPTSAVSMH